MIIEDKIEVEVFDAHVHPRQGTLSKIILPFTARSCAGAIMILNYDNPVDTVEKAGVCQKEIIANTGYYNFKSYLTLMLTKNTTPETVRQAKKARIVGFKLIPAGTSTGSEDVGVTLFDLLNNKKSVLQETRDQDLVFLIHLELIKDKWGNIIPLIQREEAAIWFLDDIINRVPGLKISIEHVTTRKLVNYILRVNSPYLGASVTAHHPCATYDQVCNHEGIVIDPLFYCLPIFKTEEDRLGVIDFMTGEYPNKWFGSDTAAHFLSKKIIPPYKAGLFTAPAAPQIVISIFEKRNVLHLLEAYFSGNLLRFYGLPSTGRKTTFIKKSWRVPQEIDGISVFKEGEILDWQISA